jgi:hypothetical protein
MAAGLLPLEEDWPAALQENAERMAALRDNVLAATIMPADGAIWSRVSISHVQLTLDLFGRAAERDLAMGDAKASADWLQAAMRLAGAATCYAPLEHRQRIAQQLDHRAQAILVHWAQHPLQSEAALFEALSRCAQEARFWTVWENDLVADSHYFAHLEDYRVALNQSIHRWYPWEFWRDYRMERVGVQNRLTYLYYTRRGSFQPGWGPIPPLPQRGLADAAWTFRDREVERVSGDHPLGLVAPTILNLYDRETRYHGLMAAAAVAGFERVHGQLPATLNDVAAYFGETPQVLRDPWSGDDLRYQPTGFPEGTSGLALGIEPDMPLVWSVGPEQVQLVRAGATQVLQARAEMPDQWRIYSLSVAGTGVGLRYAFLIPRPAQLDYVQRGEPAARLSMSQ